MDDMKVLELAGFLENCKEHYPVSDEFNRLYGQIKGVWYSSQKNTDSLYYYVINGKISSVPQKPLAPARQ